MCLSVLFLNEKINKYKTTFYLSIFKKSQIVRRHVVVNVI